MSLIQAIFLFSGVGTFALYRISHEPEYRERRSVKLIASQPFLLALAALFTVLSSAPPTPFFMGIAGISLWLIWRDELANLSGKNLINMLYGDGRGGGQRRTDFQFRAIPDQRGQIEGSGGGDPGATC